MKRKTIKVCLAVAMMAITSSLAMGCGKSKEDISLPTAEAAASGGEAATVESVTFPLKEEKKFTMFSTINGEVDIKDTLVFKKLEEMTNVKWDVQSAMPSDVQEKRGLLISSNQYPNVFLKGGFTQSEIEKYGKQNIFIPLNDLIDQYGPNIKKMMEDREVAKMVLTSDDGNIYSLPEVKVQTPANPAFYFNKKWLSNLKLDEPKNLDELYQVLKAFKEQDANGNGDPNDEIPFITSTAPTDFKLLLPYFGVPYTVSTKCAEVDGQLQYIPMTDKYKKLLAFVSKLYTEGLMDKNSFIQSLDQQRAIGGAGDVIGSFFDYGPFLTVGKERDDNYGILTPFSKNSFPVALGVDVGALVITDNCPNPEVVIAWADQLYSEDGGRLALMGVEGETYKINDNGSWDWILGDYPDVSSLRAHVSLQGSGLIPYRMPKLWTEGMTDPDEKYLIDERNRAIAAGGINVPVLNISKEDTQNLASIKAEVDVYIDQYSAKVITGETDLESSWSEYIDTMKKMRADELEKIYQTAYEKSNRQ